MYNYYVSSKNNFLKCLLSKRMKECVTLPLLSPLTTTALLLRAVCLKLWSKNNSPVPASLLTDLQAVS